MPALSDVAKKSLSSGDGNVTVEIWTLFAIGVCATLLRMYSRLSIMSFRDLRADDLLVWVGVIFYAAQSGLGYEVGAAAHGLANNNMSDAQRASLSPSSQEYQLRVLGSKLQVAGWTIYCALIWSLKLSMLCFYIRLTSGLQRKHRIMIFIGFGLVVSSFIAAILAIFLSCRPFHKYWQINPDPGNACQAAVSRPIVWASWAANASTDIYLIVIPVPMLWRSSLRMYKKIAATLVFSSGILVLVFATLKTAAVLVDPIDGAASSADWGIREAFVAVITTNLPMIFHLLRTWLRPIMGRALGTSRREYKTPSDLQTIGGGRVGGGSGGYLNRGRRGGHQPDSVTSNIRYSDDMERIVGSVKMNDMNTVTESEPETLPGDGILVSNKLEVNLESGSMSRRSSERPMAQNPVLNEW